MKTEYKPLSIYIHIPFCVQKCLYCDFLSMPATLELQKAYVDCLTREIEKESEHYDSYEVQTLFVGGGTPSILPEMWMKRILDTVYNHFRVGSLPEISIEVNPGTVTEKKLKAYHDMGINRLSIGLQSSISKELELLGRIHTPEDFFHTYDYAVESGFDNINVDLMSAIPSQTIESYQETLNNVLALKPAPAHISAYSLIIEEGTPFYENMPELPDEETDRFLYKITNDILKKKGYHRYEISNYALEGFECRHNMVYWKRGEYVGFGVGAASLVENVRYNNIRNINSYVNQIQHGICALTPGMQKWDIKENVEKLSLEDQMEEFMFLGLRLTEGISLVEFQKTFGKTVDEIYPGLIERFEKQGLLLARYNQYGRKERVCLSEYGIDVSNVVMAEFLIDGS